MPISGKEMRKLFLRAGYEIVPGGKGSHWKLRKGNKTVIIPEHKELKKGLEHALRKMLEGK
jgi:predicted RNA binding protein YcfA (HicA-like mRNA interferase family)